MFRNIIVPLDGSPLAEQALPVAASIAAASNAALDVVHVHVPALLMDIGDSSWDSTLWNEERRYVDGIVSTVLAEHGVRAAGSVFRGGPAAAICERAADSGADLIVMTSNGRTGVSRAWHGSVADAIIRHSSVPVLMVRARDVEPGIVPRKRFTRVLVPLDGSPAAAEILGPVAALARAQDAEVVLFQAVRPVPKFAGELGNPFVYPSPYQRDEAATEGVRMRSVRYLADTERALRESGVTRLSAQVLVSDQVARAILEFAVARSVDCIAMTTQGRGASRLLVGSVADKVLRGSTVPLLLRRPTAVASDMPALDAATMEEQLPALGVR